MGRKHEALSLSLSLSTCTVTLDFPGKMDAIFAHGSIV